MKIAGHIARGSSNDVSKEINGVLYLFYNDEQYTDKTKIYSFIKKVVSGKIELEKDKRIVAIKNDGTFYQW